ncbi:MAG: NADH-ubiquinone oxidoreductase chain H [Ktedonobacterales bacterium]|jgi:NADH-quinone oxidoreductase subunit H|nr:MAG: NADH-ubiquinone oxidoreductase chain H [Ktedonobacterales bacterium]
MNPVLQNVIHFVITFVFSMLFLMGSASILVYLERKVQAYVQERYGPYHYGPQGILQAVIDPAKLLLKEDVRATQTDNIIFRMAPVIFFAPVITAFVVLPFSPYMTAGALATGIIYYVALSSIDVIGVFMAGWGSNNKYALIGGLRAGAQMISYELPLVLALVGAIMLTSVLAPGCQGANPDLSTCGVGSISFTQIVAAQMRPEAPWLWFVLLQPLGLLIYYICGLAETNRTPFDLPEAESELVAGYLTEYSGLRWAMFFLGEYGNMTIVSAVATAVFLGGWSLPGTAIGFWVGLLGSFWGQVVFNIIAVGAFITKMYVLLLVFLWIRATLPRLRADQLMRFAWLFLIPLTLFNILLTGVLLLLPLDLTPRLAISAVANWLLMFIVIFSFRRLSGLSSIGKIPGWARRTGKVVDATTAGTPPAKGAPELAGGPVRR